MDLKTAGHPRRTHRPVAARRVGVGTFAALALTVCGLLLVPAMASAAELGSVEGKVTDASTHLPIEGAGVCAYSVERQAVEECELTKSGGKYVISELPVGEYKFLFIADFGTLNYITQFYNDEPTLEQATKKMVASGPPLAGIDAEMQVGAKIEGTVTDASSHAAVDGVEVCALEKEVFEEKLVAVNCAETNASGQYSVGGLPSGEFKVEFFAEYLHYVTQFYEDESTFEQAKPLKVVAPEGNKAGIDAELVPISTLVPGSIGAPQLSGTPAPADTLFCSTGSWTNSPTSYSYKWLRDGTPVAGQTSSTYGVQSADLGDAISCQVTALNSYGSQTATSNILLVPAASPPPGPSPVAKKPLKCKKGFKKMKVHGKAKCVKVKKHAKTHK